MVNVAVSLRPSSPPAASLRTTGLLGGDGARGNPRQSTCGGGAVRVLGGWLSGAGDRTVH